MFSHDDEDIEDYNFGSSWDPEDAALQFRALSPVIGHETGRHPDKTVYSESTLFWCEEKNLPTKFLHRNSI